MDFFNEYHAYFCHASANFNWTMNLINSLESGKNKFKCAEYDRDYIGGKLVMDLIERFMDSSNFIVVILSPSFCESKWSMYQLLLAVEFSLEKNLGNIIPIVYKECKVPRCMQFFDPLHVSTKGWRLRLIERLGRPAKRFPKDKGICTRDGRISIDALRPITNRDVKSEPPIGQESTTPLTSHQYNKVECFHRIRLDTLLPKHSQLSGERAQVKRTSNPRQRLSADDIMDADKTIDEETKIGVKEENRIKMKTPIQHDENEERGNLSGMNRQNRDTNKRHDIKTPYDDKNRPEFKNSKGSANKTICDVVINSLQRNHKGLLPNKAAKGKRRKQRLDCKHMPTSEESSDHHKGQQTTDYIRQERHSDEGSSIPYPRCSNEGLNIPFLRYSDEVFGIRQESYSDEASGFRHPRHSDETSGITNSGYSSEDTGNSHPRHSERSLDIPYSHYCEDANDDMFIISRKVLSQMEMIPCSCGDVSEDSINEPVKEADEHDTDKTTSATGKYVHMNTTHTKIEANSTSNSNSFEVDAGADVDAVADAVADASVDVFSAMASQGDRHNENQQEYESLGFQNLVSVGNSYENLANDNPYDVITSGTYMNLHESSGHEITERQDTDNTDQGHTIYERNVTEDDYGNETVKDSLFGGDTRLQRQRTKEDKGIDILPNRKRTSSGDYEDTQSTPNEEELRKLKYMLPDRLVFEGKQAKYKRRRSGNKKRLDADILLNNEV